MTSIKNDNKKKANLMNEIFGNDGLDDYEPEDIDAFEDTHRVRFADEEEHVQPSKAAKKVAMTLRTQSELDETLTTGAYSGKSVSRRTMFANDDNYEDDFSELQTDEYLRELKAAKKRLDYEKEGFEYNESDSDDEGNKRLQSHLSQLLQDDRDIVLRGVQNEKAIQKKKAQSVFNQKMLYDQLLKLRILVQKPLTVCNQLPQNDVFLDIMEHAGQDAQKACVETRAMLFDMLAETLSLQHELFSRNLDCKNDQNTIVNADTLNNIIRSKRRRTENGSSDVGGSSDEEEEEETDMMDDIWNVVQSSYDIYSNYRSESLEKWNRRTRIQSASNTKQFKSLNADLMTQVNNALKEKRIVSRVHVKRFPEKILGKRSRSDNEQNDQSEIIDEQIFDDKDFYQTLLRDLIQDVGTAYEVKGSTISSALQSQHKTKKNKDDTLRFSRNGKTIAYNVHEKLVNFMTPEESEIPKSADTLFLNLFGGGTVIYEESDEEEEETETAQTDGTDDAEDDDNVAGNGSHDDEDLSSFMN